MITWDKFQQDIIDALNETLMFLIGAPEAFNSHIDWSKLIASLSIKLATVVILLLFYYVFHKLLHILVLKIAKRFKTSEETKKILTEGMRYLWWFASSIAVLAQTGVSKHFITSYARAVFIAAFFFFIWRTFNHLLEKLSVKYALSDSLNQLVHNLCSVIIVVLAFGALLKQFGFDLVSIVAGLGIVGIAVGFAAQSTLANFIAGVTILIERPFGIGDWVVINSHTGKINKISLRTTHLQTRANRCIIIPNDNVASADIVNLSARKYSAYKARFGIAYEADIDKTREAVLKHIHKSFSRVLSTPPSTIIIENFGDSSVNLYLRYWINEACLDTQPVLHANILEAIKHVLDDEGIEIPYPHIQLMQGK